MENIIDEAEEAYNRYIIHIDMDSYYAQVEMKRHKLDLKVRYLINWNIDPYGSTPMELSRGPELLCKSFRSEA